MPRFLTSKGCLWYWYPASSNYCSITVLIFTSHHWSVIRPPVSFQAADMAWGTRQYPACHHAQTGKPLISRSLEFDSSVMSMSTQTRKRIQFEELQGISFQIFQKKSDTQESHMAQRKCFVVDQFYFQLKYSLHIYMFLNT